MDLVLECVVRTVAGYGGSVGKLVFAALGLQNHAGGAGVLWSIMTLINALMTACWPVIGLVHRGVDVEFGELDGAFGDQRPWDALDLPCPSDGHLT
ncbi:hypothetical protein [Mycobacterium lepromatosis]|uniref:hypothetical protein n=1 Tax=Mycobacterium lepromatosis TaxID=480418 RepID=UPI0005F876FF|nr:hypothetical protein [Mycobacterium lepromatosis]